MFRAVFDDFPYGFGRFGLLHNCLMFAAVVELNRNAAGLNVLSDIISGI